MCNTQNAWIVLLWRWFCNVFTWEPLNAATAAAACLPAIYSRLSLAFASISFRHFQLFLKISSFSHSYWNSTVDAIDINYSMLLSKYSMCIDDDDVFSLISISTIQPNLVTNFTQISPNKINKIHFSNRDHYATLTLHKRTNPFEHKKPQRLVNDPFIVSSI